MVLANANANGTQQTPGVLSASSDGLPSQGSAATLGSNIGNESENEDVPMIDKAQALERLKQARKRRTQQLKKYSQYEKQLEKDAQKKKKLLTSSDDAASARSRRVQFSQNLLLLEAASRGDLDEVAALLARGISPDSANEDGLTALHQCCIDDNEPMCRLLIQYRAKIDSLDSELWTPLHAAATCGHANICKVLIENGANLVAVNADGNMAYDICEDEYTLSYIESEMAKRGITQEQIDEMRGERERQTLNDLKQWLVDGGDTDVVVDPRSGATILHVAAANGWLSVCEHALSQGASVDTEDRDGWQPIHVAACWGYVDEVQLMVDYGADPEARTRGGESIVDLCEEDELRRRVIDIRSDPDRRGRLQRARVAPTPSLLPSNGMETAPRPDTAGAPASPSLLRNNGSVRMRSSFSHGSPSGGNNVANSNRNSIRRSSLRRSSMRQKSLMSQREAEADGELRQQAAEALAAANDSTPDADSVDDLDSANTRKEPAFEDSRLAGNTSPADKYVVQDGESNRVALANGYAPQNEAALKSQPAISQSEKKSVLKNTSVSLSQGANNRPMLLTVEVAESNPPEETNTQQKRSGKGCCVLS